MEQATQQNNVHPMAAASAQTQALPIQSVLASANKASNVTTITMGKLSLFSISLSLMLLGSLTFFSGFLLGMWFSAPTPGAYLSPLGNKGQTSGYTAPLPQQQYSSSGDNPLPGTLQYVTSQQVGNMVQSAITEAQPTNLPNFLTPLVSSTASAMGRQAGQKAQQETSHLMNQAASTVHKAVTAPVQSASSTTILPPSSASTTTSHTNAPTTVPQPSSPSSPQSSTTSPKSSTSSENYTVQLGVYASKENASNLVSHLQGQNINSQITQSKASDGGTMYYVHSGLYGNYNMAQDAASQFADQIPGALVVKVSENKAGHS